MFLCSTWDNETYAMVEMSNHTCDAERYIHIIVGINFKYKIKMYNEKSTSPNSVEQINQRRVLPLSSFHRFILQIQT